ncbi:DNA primase [Bacteroides sp. OF04-15BH]|uniref:DNA primase n=1 Tax=Bacteroides sp. OF04-15BH TaxID=2292281 RepID=UPI000E52AE09|nr:DNA primase [Bacteroides sp. OF04-15BH]RHP66624.1 DNA primase [Bacteroides sp. OF04-15BH]
MIDRATVERIMDAAQIVDVVSDFVTLRRAGVNYKGLCPFHDDRTPSFVVSPAKGLCKCFACGKGGNAVHFIMEHEQLSYPDALRYLARKYHIEIQERELTDQEKLAQSERESMFVVNEWARDYFEQQLYDTVDGRAIGMAYFRSRGFRDDIIKRFQLGFSPMQKDALAREALAKGFREEYLVKTGLCIKQEHGGLKDRFWGRVIFPIHTVSGKVVGFGGRVLDQATKGVNMKYQNSPESSIYSKKKELYGLFQAKQAIVKNDLCFLVEGYTDVISMHQMGVEHVVSSSGTALTQQQIQMIHRFTENITVLYDGDAAGIKASERGIDMLLAEGMNVKVLLLPDGDDPDSFARNRTATEYQAYLKEHQVDFIKFKTDLLLQEAQGDPIKLSRLVHSIVCSIAVVPDEIMRTLYTRETAAMLGMEEKVLVSAINKQMSVYRTEQKKRRQNEERREQTAPVVSNSTASDEPASAAGAPVEPAEGAMPQNPQPDTPVETQPEAKAEEQSAEESTQFLSYIQKGQNGHNMAFYQKELLLVQVLIRYGEYIVCYVEDEQGQEVPFTVVEFIYYALQEDKLNFQVALHQRILDEALEHFREPDFSAQRYFLNHPDQAVSTLAFQLTSDKYQLSKYHTKNQKLVTDEDRLFDLVRHLMTDFKLAIIDEELKGILNRLRDPLILKDKEAYMKVMKHYMEVKEVESTLAKERGDRVITSL